MSEFGPNSKKVKIIGAHRRNKPTEAHDPNQSGYSLFLGRGKS